MHTAKAAAFSAVTSTTTTYTTSTNATVTATAAGATGVDTTVLNIQTRQGRVLGESTEDMCRACPAQRVATKPKRCQ